MKRRLLFFFLLVSSFAFAQNNIYRSGGITQTIGAPTFTPGASGNIVAIDTVTGEWYVNPNRLSGASWISAGYRLTVISGSIAPAYTPTAHQSHFVINAANNLYYWTGSAWVNINAGGGGGGTTYYAGEGIDITNDTISIDTVQRLIFHSDQTYTGGIGAMRWNDTEGTLDLGLKNGNVTLQLGQESLQLVKHADNSGLTDGKVVYLVGSSGTNMTVRYARADNESTSANTFGLMTESATGGNKAFCTTFGLVRNINTDNLTEGGMVWLSKDTAGAMTAVRPTAPNHGVEIGLCVRKHATQGVIFVTVQNGYELNELHNVYVPSPSNGQVLTYDSADSRWEAATVADQSATNEIQTIDTFSLSGQTLRASLSNDNQPAKTVTLPVVGISAGTNVTVSEAAGVYTINSSGGSGGITSLNGLTASTQTFATGTTGSDFNIASSTSTHTFNLPIAATGTTGKLSSTDWNTFNNKVGGSGTSGQVAYWSGTSTQTGSANFTWDATGSERVNIGSALSSAARASFRGATDLSSSYSIIAGNNSGTEFFRVRNDGIIQARGNFINLGTDLNVAFGATANGGSFAPNGGDLLFAGSNGGVNNSCAIFNIYGGRKIVNSGVFWLNGGTFDPTSTSNTYSIISINPGVVINQTGTANGITRGLYIAPTLTSAIDYRAIEWNNNSGWGLYGVGTATNYLAANTSVGTTTTSARLHVRGSNTSSGTNAFLVQNSRTPTPDDIHKIENNGRISYWATNTSAGTTGAQTIDKPSGIVNFAAGASALVVTNSLVSSTTSIVFAVVRTNDSTAYVKNVVPAAGSFTINLGAAATAETSVGWWVIN